MRRTDLCRSGLENPAKEPIAVTKTSARPVAKTWRRAKGTWPFVMPTCSRPAPFHPSSSTCAMSVHVLVGVRILRINIRAAILTTALPGLCLPRLPRGGAWLLACFEITNACNPFGVLNTGSRFTCLRNYTALPEVIVYSRNQVLRGVTADAREGNTSIKLGNSLHAPFTADTQTSSVKKPR